MVIRIDYNGYITIMAYSIILKEKAAKLRKGGYSLNEIHQKLGVSKSIVSDWVRTIVLNNKARLRLLNKIKVGQAISAKNKKKKTNQIIKAYYHTALTDISSFNLDKNSSKIICSLIYYCEGVKDMYSGVRFINSDPKLVETFLKLLRESFDVDEKKFRVCAHLHKYHVLKKQLNFWSKTTQIPLSQFIKPYIKQNTGKRIRKGYNGCVSIRYHDIAVARQLLSIARAFFQNKGA